MPEISVFVLVNVWLHQAHKLFCCLLQRPNKKNEILVIFAPWMRFTGRHLSETSSSELDGGVQGQNAGDCTKITCTWRLNADS